MKLTKLIAVLCDEIVRQAEAEGEAPWIEFDKHSEVIRIDGYLDLGALAAAVMRELETHEG